MMADSRSWRFGAAILAWVTASCGAPTIVLELQVELDPQLGAHAPQGTFVVAPRDGGAGGAGGADGADGAVVTRDAACTAEKCTRTIEVPRGAYDISFILTLLDRCGLRQEVATFTGSAFPEGTFIIVETLREDPTRARDTDGDGINNLAELAVCGRFDVPDRDLPPAHCAGDTPDSAACCADARDGDLRGQRALFIPAARDRGAPAPFTLDATEVTWGTLRRCLAATGCLTLEELSEVLSEDVRDAVVSGGVLLDAPVRGITPDQALRVCSWLGKRLPTDAEWVHAAAHRPGLEGRGKYPFDVGAGQRVSCREPAEPAPGEPPTVAANHAAAGEPCPKSPLPVGSFPSSHVHRGAGSPVADLAGNVAEWTVSGRDGNRAPTTFTDVRRVHLRGGGAEDLTFLLSNAVVFSADVENGDEIARLSRVAGFRCAGDARTEEEPRTLLEPMCGGEP